MNVTPTAPTVLPTGTVPALGTMRRLRALAAAGWPTRPIARLTGVAPRAIRRLRAGQRHHLPASVAARIAEQYDYVFSSVRPERALPDRPAARQAITATREVAARTGWTHLPTVWEGLDMDDPAVTPATGLRTARTRRPRSGTAEEVLELLASRAARRRIRLAWGRANPAEKRRVVCAPEHDDLTAVDLAAMLGVTQRTVLRYRGPSFAREFPTAAAS